MKINICNYEQSMGINGILTKYAQQMANTLNTLNHHATISAFPVKKADVNHHINYLSYQKSPTVDTLMVTHITTDKNQEEREKIERLKEGLKTAHGICFSKGMVDKLVKVGCKKEKLAFVLPAHDPMQRRPRLIAIATKLYPDGRKREEMFVKMFKSLEDKKSVIFQIMGDGWKELLEGLKGEGIQVQWAPGFNPQIYNQILNQSDYLLYTGGEDALAQSIIDAKHCGLPIIAPPQEDIEIEKPFKTQEELNRIFKDITFNPVKDWSWENYCKSHLKIWSKLYENNTKKGNLKKAI